MVKSASEDNAAASNGDFVPHGKEMSDDTGFPLYLEKIATAQPQTDQEGETFIDLKDCGWINDRNQLKQNVSRRRLWESYPELEGRVVIFDYAQPLLDKVKEAFGELASTVVITGTPGIGKSALRNVHAHLLLANAKANGEPCSVLFAKGGDKKMYHLHVTASGRLHAEMIFAEDDWALLGFRNFCCKPGVSLFILADISKGIDRFTAG